MEKNETKKNGNVCQKNIRSLIACFNNNDCPHWLSIDMNKSLKVNMNMNMNMHYNHLHVHLPLAFSSRSASNSSAQSAPKIMSPQISIHNIALLPIATAFIF